VTAKYFLKNTADITLKNQKVFFSDFQPKFLNGFHYAEEVYDQSFLEYLVLLYEKNNFAQDVEVTFDNKKIDASKSLIFEKANSSILNTKLPPKNIIYAKEVSAFELDFSPKQSHILEVKYKIPAFTFYDKESTVFYDFSPIFSWK
jgi:hypothetical protein